MKTIKRMPADVGGPEPSATRPPSSRRLRSGWARAVAVLAASLSVALLAACGGSDSNESASTLTASQVKQANGEINVAAYSFYEVPKTQNVDGVSAKWAYYNDNQDMLTKIRSGNFDVAQTDSSMVAAVSALEPLPIQTELIPNYENIAPVFRDDPAFKNANGEVIAVPFASTPELLAWDSSRVGKPETIDDLLKDEFADGIGLWDSPDIIQTIAMQQGVEDTQKMTQDDLDRVMEYLDQLRPNVKSFYSFGGDARLYLNGTIVASFGSYGTVLSKIIEQKPSVDFRPLGQWINAWVMPQGSDAAPALKWINNTLSDKSQKSLVEASGDYPAVPAGVEALATSKDPVMERFADLSYEQLLEAAPALRGNLPQSDDENVVTTEDLIRAWNSYKGSFG